MVKKYVLSITLTAREANIVWGLLDGQIDAGSCEGGLSDEETDAASKVTSALLRISLKDQKDRHHDR